jgi:very-short-patch-repair endonuclease
MRRFPTEPERRLWGELRGGALGVAFRRQVVIGQRYIVDFVAPAVRLIVEVDGAAVHARRWVADARRDRDLTRLGYRVLRVNAAVVMGDVRHAVALVQLAVGGAC